MAHVRTPKSIQTDFDIGHNHRQEIRSARGWPPRASRGEFNRTPTDACRGLEHGEGGLESVRDQFRADRTRVECRQSNGPLLHENSHASTSHLEEPRNRSGHPVPHPQTRQYQGTGPVDVLNGIWPRVASLSRDREVYFTRPPPHSLSPNHKTRQRKSSQEAHKYTPGSTYRPLAPSLSTDRFEQGRSDWPSVAIQPRHYSTVPVDHPSTGSTPRLSAHKLCGLTRRPRVQNPSKRVSRVPGDILTGSVDLGSPPAMEMGYSVMSVRHSNPDGSGSSFSSRFALPPTTARPTPIGRSDGGARPRRASPSSHVEPETERSISRIKARDGAGSASANTYSIPKKEPHTLTIPSLMNHGEDGWIPLSPVSTPKAPLLDQHSMIREDLQQEDDERPIAGHRADPRISSGEIVAVEDGNSLGFVHSPPPSLEVPHLPSHAAPANKGDNRNQPGQQSLFQELYQMLEPSAHPASDILRPKVGIRRGEGSWEASVLPGEESDPETPRGIGGPEQTLHVDVLLAQRVARDAMQEDEESVGFPIQSSMPSASECGEEAVDSSCNLSECMLDRKHSTRSVFDWGYA